MGRLPGAARAAEPPPGPPPGPAVTARVFLEVGLCPTAFNNARTIGATTALCEEPAPLGRLELGLFGEVAPDTVANFLTLVDSGALTYTTFYKTFPGEYILGGKQGSHRYGMVQAPEGIRENTDVVRAEAFRLRHDRGGLLTLLLAPNEVGEEAGGGAEGFEEAGGGAPKADLEFAITTGPGPVPALDGTNIVFGRVDGGLGTVQDIAEVPRYDPAANIRGFNMLASVLGDSRSKKAQASWGKPLKAVVITACGRIQPEGTQATPPAELGMAEEGAPPVADGTGAEAPPAAVPVPAQAA